MKTRAAVAVEAGKPLEIMEVDLDGPRSGEVLVEIKATGICHTDEFTLSGDDPEGLFPAILGHEGAGVVKEVGRGVTSLKEGDHVIPLYTPECRECEYCLNPKTNLCQAIRTTQGQGVMPDGTSRFSIKGKPVLHYMGTSTFSNYTVVPEIALAKVNKSAPFDKICYIGCGVTTGIGAVINTAKASAGCNAVVFGLGGIGLNVIQGLRMIGANMIVGVDMNNKKEAWGKKFGMTHFVNPSEIKGDLVNHLVELTGGGADYSFECIGNVNVMRQALECAHKGWGESIIIGVAGAGQEITTRPFQLVTGRSWRGTAFGGARGRTDVPKIVEWYLQGKIDIDPMITHTLDLEDINKGFDLMEKLSEAFSHGGTQAVYTHKSIVNNCDMTFAIFTPPIIKNAPVLWYLSGLTCNHLNVMEKGEYRKKAAELGMVIICPDTSPRGDEVVDEKENWQFGSGAGFYLDATNNPFKENYNMYSYITLELPKVIEDNFDFDMSRQSIFGHSMGGHGALIMALRNPKKYKSCSAFAPIVEPTTASWSSEAFKKYLGPNENEWSMYDSVSLVKKGYTFPEILIDQGQADSFLDEGLRPWLLEEACKDTPIKLKLRMHPSYDHSYFFISSFMSDHLNWHKDRI